MGDESQTAFVEVAYGANQGRTLFAVLHWTDCGLDESQAVKKTKLESQNVTT